MIDFQRAPKGGIVGINGRLYRGGEILPFYVPRPRMPQIDPEDLDGFLAFAKSKGVFPLHERRDPFQLHAHQRIDRFDPGEFSPLAARLPILINVQDFVLDGNHRWLYHVIYGDNPIEAWALPLPFQAAIDLMFAYPKTYCLADHPEKN